MTITAPPSLPLGGGTVTGEVNLTASGTALNVTNNIVAGGQVTTPTITSASGSILNISPGGSSNGISIKNGPNGGGAILLEIGGSNQNIAPNTYIELPGGTWGSGALAASQAPISQNATFTGSTSSAQAAFGAFLQQTDTGTVISGSAPGIGFQENLNLNGAAVSGWRGAGMFNLNIYASTANTISTGYTGLTGKCYMGATDANVPGGGGSACFGGNFVAEVGQNVATAGLVGLEVDVISNTGAIIIDRVGTQIVDCESANGYGVQASRDDVSLSLNNQYSQSSSLGFKIGLEFGRAGGHFPINTTGTMIYAQNQMGEVAQAGTGIDFRLVNFATSFFEMQGSSMSGAGTLRIGKTYLSDTTNGLTINPLGSVGVSATVASGGSGFNGSGYPTLADSHGGLWAVTGISANAVTTVSMISAPYLTGSAPANPVSVSTISDQPGTGCTLNITWQTGSTVVMGAPVELPAYTVSTLPAASTTYKGCMAYVTDATSPTYNGTLTGGGTVIVPVFCNGSAWLSH